MKIAISLFSLLSLFAAGTVMAATTPLRVAYAGSMGAVMDKGLGPTFASAHDVKWQGHGQGSYGLAHLISAKKLRPDVFVAITPGPLKVVQKAGLMGKAVPVASTQMVIAYSPKSQYATDFEAVADGKKDWYKILETKGLRFGRTDPTTDPQGRNIVLTMQLAARYYKKPGLMKKILGKPENPQQIFTETSLLSRLEAGQVDASSGYLAAVKSHHLPYITLPEQINLSNPAMASQWYSKAGFDLKKPGGGTTHVRVQPLVYYAGVLEDARHPEAARAFVKFLATGAAQKIFKNFGYNRPKGGPLMP